MEIQFHNKRKQHPQPPKILSMLCKLHTNITADSHLINAKLPLSLIGRLGSEIKQGQAIEDKRLGIQ